MKRNILGTLLALTTAVSAIAQQDNKNLAPEQGKALVYFVRPSKLGTLITFMTTFDDKIAGRTKGKQFVYTMMDAGPHTIMTTGGEKDATLNLTTEANKIYFVEIVPKMGMIAARVKMEVLTEEDGRKKLEKCNPVQSPN